MSPITLSSRSMVFIDMNGLANSSKFIRSIDRGQIVMWLISARALDKVGPSICVSSDSIGSIMHDTGRIVFSPTTGISVPVVVVEMDGMPMARQFPFGGELVSRRGISGAWASLYSPT